MTADEVRLRVLRMVEAGRLSAAEGARLLAAAEATRPAEPPPPRWLRLRATRAGTDRPEVDVTLPFGVARALAGLVDRLVPRGIPELEALAEAVAAAVTAGVRGPVASTTDERGDRLEIVVD